jgi:hypothetical protein
MGSTLAKTPASYRGAQAKPAPKEKDLLTDSTMNSLREAAREQAAVMI